MPSVVQAMSLYQIYLEVWPKLVKTAALVSRISCYMGINKVVKYCDHHFKIGKSHKAKGNNRFIRLIFPA